MSEQEKRERWQEIKKLVAQAERDWSIADGEDYPTIKAEEYRRKVEELRQQEKEAFRSYMEAND